jgi:XTP/dITP diphosphohydrolase
VIELYLATTNAGKLRDFNHALAPGYSLVPLPGLAGLPVPEETAATFQGNAEIKAVAYSLAAPGKYVLADDSGLEVEALGGAPGVRSARFAEDEGFALDGTTDARNNACLQARLLAHPLERAARYRCTLALARNGRVEATADGTVEGEMLAQPRGSGGFGYDPLFLLPELGLTMAEIDVPTRQRYSHRASALAALLCELDGRQRELHRR